MFNFLLNSRQDWAGLTMACFYKFVFGEIENFQYEEDSPDTITMFHVLEHLPRPVTVLKKLSTISHSATKLIVEVPILEKSLTNDINGFFSVTHTTHFSRCSLKNALLAGGWNIIEEYGHQEYNGFRVIATPHKSNEIELTRNASDWYKLQNHLSSWYQSIHAIEQKLLPSDQFEQCVLWGGGLHTEILYQVASFFHKDKNREYIIVDSDPIKQGTTWRGLYVYDPNILQYIDLSNRCLILSSYGGQNGIAKATESIEIPSSKIIQLYDFIRGRKVS